MRAMKRSNTIVIHTLTSAQLQAHKRKNKHRIEGNINAKRIKKMKSEADAISSYIQVYIQ